MLKIYTLKIESFLDNTELNKNLKFISPERFQKISNYKNNKNKTISFFSEVLIRYAISCLLSIPMDNITFSFNNLGKPTIQTFPQIHFNISHTNDFIVCAISNQPVGIDTEKKNPIEINLVTSSLHHYESSFLDSLSEPERTNSFYNVWCLKESYLKYRGDGLFRKLNDFYFIIPKNGHGPIKLHDKQIKPKNLHFYLVNSYVEYSIAVCSANSSISSIVQLTQMQLYSTWKHCFKL